MELDIKLRDNFGSGIRNRIFFYFIISLIMNIFFFQHGSDTISIMITEFVPCVLAFFGFAAVQFIERKRDS